MAPCSALVVPLLVTAELPRLQAGASVGVYFHANKDLDDAWCFPCHCTSPVGLVI
jgi:hypothetical protein